MLLAKVPQNPLVKNLTQLAKATLFLSVTQFFKIYSHILIYSNKVGMFRFANDLAGRNISLSYYDHIPGIQFLTAYT